MFVERSIEQLRDRLGPIAKSLNIEDTIAPIYHQLQPIDPSIKHRLSNINFPEINNKNVDEVAIFTDLYPIYYRTIYSGLLAHVLYNHGIGSIFVYDHKQFKTCQKKDSNVDCVECVNKSEALTDLMGLNRYYMKGLDLDDTDIPSVVNSKMDRFAQSAASRKLKIAEVNQSNQKHQELVGDFIQSAEVLWKTLSNLDKKFNFKYIFSYSSPRVPRRIAIEYGSHHNKVVIGTTDPGFGIDNGHLFNYGEGPLPTYISESVWNKLLNRGISKEELNEVEDLLLERSTNIRQQQYTDKNTDVKEKIELDTNKHIYSMFTHLVWDAAADQIVSRVYDSHREWVIETIKQFENNDKQLIVKTHPAEAFRDGNDSMIGILDEEFEKTPSNIQILSPDTIINSYNLIRESDVIIVNTSTVGLESAILGKPVITVGDAHYAKKGFTFDPSNKQQYIRRINNIGDNKKIGGGKIKKAKIYGYNYFIERPKYLTDLLQPWWNVDNPDEILEFEKYEEVVEHDELNKIAQSIKNDGSYFYFDETRPQ